jgi:hypothetical protein
MNPPKAAVHRESSTASANEPARRFLLRDEEILILATRGARQQDRPRGRGVA